MRVPSGMCAKTPPAEMGLHARRDDSARSARVCLHVHVYLNTVTSYCKDAAHVARRNFNDPEENQRRVI